MTSLMHRASLIKTVLQICLRYLVTATATLEQAGQVTIENVCDRSCFFSHSFGHAVLVLAPIERACGQLIAALQSLTTLLLAQLIKIGSVPALPCSRDVSVQASEPFQS